MQAEALTEVGFHQASYNYAFRMKHVAQGRESGEGGQQAGYRPQAGDERDEDGRLTGKVLRLWRPGRPGQPDTAADVGALAGAPVVAPISGTVLKVKAYKLYGKYDDVQVHIGPDGTPTSTSSSSTSMT